MVRRGWQCYRIKRGVPGHKFKPAYQKKRSRSHRKEFVRGGADAKIRMYDIGNKERPLDEWEISIGVRVLNRIQISHLALEAVRTSVNRTLGKKLTRTAYHIRMRAHPYHIYRENKMMAFAGADRLQCGMRNSFGRPVGSCARMEAGQVLCEVYCDIKSKDTVIEAMKVSRYKIGCETRLVLLRMKDPSFAGKVGLPVSLEV